PESQAVNECLKPTEVSNDPESSKDSESESLTLLPPLKNLQGASSSSKVMSLTYQPYSLKSEKPGLGIMKHTTPETQESSRKSVSGPVTINDTKPVTPSVPTKVKNTEQESKINELTKLVQMFMDEKINSKTHEQKPKSSNSGSSSKVMAIFVISVLSDSFEESVGTSTGRVILFASDTEFDPSEDPSSDHIPPLPTTSPFLSSTDDYLDSDIPNTPSSPTHGRPFTETTLSTQSSPVASGALRRRVMVLAPGQPIPHGRLYRYHLNGPVPS
ncbi:hypothetical protein Tco_1073564, partial [Tanacetum coccineum]